VASSNWEPLRSGGLSPSPGQRAWADLRQAAADSIKLGLAERRARIEDDQVELVTNGNRRGRAEC
jgi:hypothetical protein